MYDKDVDIRICSNAIVQFQVNLILHIPLKDS